MKKNYRLFDGPIWTLFSGILGQRKIDFNSQEHF